MKEIWKPIPGYLHHKVSNYGRVKNVNRIDTNGHRHKGKIKSQTKNPNGYMYVTIHENRKVKNCPVHRLVLLAFVGESKNDKTQVNHIDENKTNNNLSNLEWMSPKDNTNYGTGTERMAKTKRKPVRCVETGIVYEGARVAERITGIRNSSICAVCNKRPHYNTAGGYHWEYVK